MNQKEKPATPMLVKFKTGYDATRIERIEAIRETAECVILPINGRTLKGKVERREAKRSEWAQYHDTWVDAHAYLVERAEAQVQGLRLQLQRASGTVGNLKGMKQPEDAE
jgi:hypothetical protein